MAVVRAARVSPIDVIDRVLDKGIVIEYEARLSMLGVDLCTTIEARVVMASIETFSRYAPEFPGAWLAAWLTRMERQE